MNRNLVCRLCLKPNDGDKQLAPIANDNNKIKMLSFFIPNLNIKLSKDPKICNNCTANLMAAYNFKKTALDNEHKVIASVPRWPPGKVNLKVLEVDEQVKKDLDSPTCRVCLKCSSMNNIPLYDEPCYAHSFKLVRSLVTSCIHSLNYDLSEKPILCNGCWNLLQTVYLFKRNLVETEERLINYRASHKSKLLSNLDLVRLIGLKVEDKADQVQNNNENIDLNNVSVKKEPLDGMGGNFSEESVMNDNNNKENTAKKGGRKKVARKLTRRKRRGKPSSNKGKKQENVLKPVETGNKGLMSPKAKEKEKFLALFSLHTEKIITGLQKRRITRRSKKLGLDEVHEEVKKKGKQRKTVEENGAETSPRRLTRSSGVVEPVQTGSKKTEPKKKVAHNKTDDDKLAETSTSSVEELPTNKASKKKNKTWGLIKSADIPMKTKVGWQNAFKLLSTEKKLLEKKVESVLRALILKQRASKLARRNRILRRKRLLEERKKRELEVQDDKSKIVRQKTPADLGNCTNNNLSEQDAGINTLQVDNVQSVAEQQPQSSRGYSETTMDVKPLDQDPVIKNMRKITDYFKKRSEIDVSVVPLRQFLKPNTSTFSGNSTGNSDSLIITPVNKVEFVNDIANSSEDFSLDLSINSDISATNNNLQSGKKRKLIEVAPQSTPKKLCSIDLTIESVVNNSMSPPSPPRNILPSAKISIIPPGKSKNATPKTNLVVPKTSPPSITSRLPSPPIFTTQTIIPDNFKFLTKANDSNLTISPVTPDIVSYVKGEMPNTADKEKKFVCNICYFSTKYRHHLMRHLLIHMDPETLPQYQCPHCPYKSVKKQYLKSHMLRHDPHAAQFKCEFCSYMTNRKDRLRLHTMTHIPDAQPKVLQCPYCPYTAARKQNLDCHLISHEAEAKFACTECDYKTKRKSHLVTHMLRHADPEMVNIYHCLHCPYKAKRKHHLQIHLNKSCKGKKDL